MAKQLLVVRHAEAETPYWGQKDFDRELTSHGIISASVTGKKLKEIGFVPDFILTSAANRAQNTAILLAEQFGYETTKIREAEELYNCGLNVLLEYIHKVDENYQNVVLVNHNPNISYLVEYLTGENLYGGMNPIGIASIIFDFDHWAEVGQRTGKLLWYKELYHSEF
jgi:phosphohistidine phosphatase